MNTKSYEPIEDVRLASAADDIIVITNKKNRRSYVRSEILVLISVLLSFFGFATYVSNVFGWDDSSSSNCGSCLCCTLHCHRRCRSLIISSLVIMVVVYDGNDRISFTYVVYRYHTIRFGSS